ncbi:MAG: hypothetical protein LUD29_02545 [Clostridia bacterium]|nr:hypothetical protein [Clostridia bacterium]
MDSVATSALISLIVMAVVAAIFVSLIFWRRRSRDRKAISDCQDVIERICKDKSCDVPMGRGFMVLDKASRQRIVRSTWFDDKNKKMYGFVHTDPLHTDKTDPVFEFFDYENIMNCVVLVNDKIIVSARELVESDTGIIGKYAAKDAIATIQEKERKNVEKLHVVINSRTPEGDFPYLFQIMNKKQKKNEEYLVMAGNLFDITYKILLYNLTKQKTFDPFEKPWD